MPSSYPLSIEEVDVMTAEKIKEEFRGLRKYGGFVRIGPKGYFFPNTLNLREQMSCIYNMDIRSTDIFVSTFPRSGTTWTQELVWLIANDLDYRTAKSKHLIERYTTLGSYFINSAHELTKMDEYKARKSAHLDKLTRMVTPPTQILAQTPEPRFIKNHIPISMLPPDVLDKARMIYVARDPRDAAVSLFHLSRLLTTFDFVGDFKRFWEFFMEGWIVRSPYFEQVKEAWDKKDHPHMLFLFYEELSEDLRAVIKKICNFLNKQYTDEQISGLCEHLDFKNFKENQSVNLDFLKEFGAISNNAESFIRKGKTGGWLDYFDEEMLEQAKIWMEHKLRDTDLKFPQLRM